MIAFFRTRQSLCKNKIPGEFSRTYFPSCFLFLVRFLHCAFGVVHDVRLTFFGCRKTVLFGSSTLFAEHGYHISPPTTGLNLESAEISTSKLANSKQQMSQSIRQFPKCTLISSPLFRWKWPTQVGTLGTLCWGRELGMLQIHL